MVYKKKTYDPSRAEGLDDPLLTVKEAAEYLRINEGTLAIWRCREKNKIPGNPDYVPEYINIGRHIRYKMSSIKAYVKKTGKSKND